MSGNDLLVQFRGRVRKEGSFVEFGSEKERDMAFVLCITEAGIEQSREEDKQLVKTIRTGEGFDADFEALANNFNLGGVPPPIPMELDV